MKNFGGRLPDGKQTSNADEYVAAWRAFAKPVATTLGATLYGFDPGVSYNFKGRVIQFDTDVLMLLNVALAKCAETK